MFFFQSMFQQVYNGITGSAVLPAVQQIAEGILLLAALFAVYEAYAKGGDARHLALAGVRYLIMGLLISQYPNVFRNVNNAFASVAQAIAPTDVWTNFRDQVQSYFSANTGQGACGIGWSAAWLAHSASFSRRLPFWSSRFRTPFSRFSTACMARFYMSLGRWCWRCIRRSAWANWRGHSW